MPGALSNQPPNAAAAPVTLPPGTQAGLMPAPNGQQNQARPVKSNKEATTNYEVDRTIQHVRQQTGALKRVTAAVVVNFKRTTTADGNAKMTPLSEQEMQQLDKLVREAMGFTQARGDSVQVVNASFADTAGSKAALQDRLLDYASNNPGEILKWVLGALVVLYLLFGVVYKSQASVVAFVILAIPSILAGAYAGFEAIDRTVIDAGRAVGMTEWQVLEKFCNGRYGKSPRITGAGFALMCGTYGGAKPIVFGRNGVGYTSLREYIKPCKVISQVKLRTEEYGGYKSVISNKCVADRIKRVRYVNAFLDNNAVKTADRMIENGNRQSFEIMLECAECLCGVVGRRAVIDDSLIGKREGLIVKSIKYSLGKNGESTTVVLGKENGDVADELHN